MSARSPSLRRLVLAGAAALIASALAIALWSGLQGEAQASKTAPATAKAQTRVPAFQLDASWPKGLPNDWAWGGADSVWVDRRDHVWVLTRPLGVPAAELEAGKIPAPPVVELDEEGEFVRGWGGPQWVQPWFATETPL